MARTTDELTAEIQLSGMLPANQELLTAERILSFATEQMESKLVPLIQSLNQAYLVATSTLSLQPGKQSFAIPARALGRAIQGVRLVDSASSGEVAIPLITLDDATMGTYSSSPTPSAFYFMGDRLWSANKLEGTSTYSLKFYYLERPGRLVPVNSCSRIVGVTTDGTSFTTLTVNQVADGFVAGSVCDVIQGAAGNSAVAKDAVISNILGTDITYGYLDAEIEIGDYICPQFKSCVLQVPEEAFGYLVALTTEKALKAIGDLEGASVIAKDIPELKKMFEGMLAPRLASENYKIVNRYGLLRGSRGFGPGFR